MKNVKLTKRLNLNKTTITNLDDSQLDKINGGGTYADQCLNTLDRFLSCANCDGGPALPTMENSVCVPEDPTAASR